MSEPTTQLLLVIFWISLSAVLYTYFLYPVILMLLAAVSRRKSAPDSPNPSNAISDREWPSVTMVISAYNEQAVLPEKIKNCRKLNYPQGRFTVLIGSDGSDDGTCQILRRCTDPQIQWTHNHIRRGKVQTLNLLMKKVTSDIVVFSDANTIYHPDAVRELVKHFDEKNVGCVIGKLDLVAPPSDEHACRTESLYWRYENRIKQWESDLDALSTINGGIFAIRRELYQQLPPQAVTEDQVLGMKIMVRGYTCRFAATACASETVSSLSGELRRRIRISAGNFQSLFLVPAILSPARGSVCFSFISHKLLRWLVPFFLVAILVTNSLLANLPGYSATLMFQGLFYASGFLAACLPKLTGALKVLAIPKYFLAMNIAILIGFARFITHKQKAAWAKTPRR